VLPLKLQNLVMADPMLRKVRWHALLKYRDPREAAGFGSVRSPDAISLCRWFAAAAHAMGTNVVFAYSPELLLGLCVADGGGRLAPPPIIEPDRVRVCITGDRKRVAPSVTKMVVATLSPATRVSRWTRPFGTTIEVTGL
jgi:hypothetical protein